MRQIKFRAWDITERQWFKQGDGFALSWDATEIYDDNGGQQPTKYIVFQQFTGRKSTSGKEIYEGDIVSDEAGNIAQVIWNQDHSQFLAEFEQETQEVGEWAEVIGNIYENYDLLP